jgi:hypothetical protein
MRKTQGTKEVGKMPHALERMELYCMANPGGPSANCRPRLSIHSGLGSPRWKVLSTESGVLGPAVEMAFRAFDAKYWSTAKALNRRRLT